MTEWLLPVRVAATALVLTYLMCSTRVSGYRSALVAAALSVALGVLSAGLWRLFSGPG